MSPRNEHGNRIASESIPDFPAPPTSRPTAQVPLQSPRKNMTGITEAQKQALIDNLQLEITERARKLRAQYALQAQGLRTRLEMRVNRIPQALRKRNIHEVLQEHSAKSRPAPPPPMPVVSKAQHLQSAQQAQASTKEPSNKRKSDEISTGDDKENISSNPTPELENPKKRSRTMVAVANSKATRTASRKAGPAGVLSPKSHNSRTLPHSPIKPSTLSPEKAQHAHAHVSAQPVPAAKRSTRAPSRQTKRTGATSKAESRASEASSSSVGTTIVSKPGTRKPAVPKKAATTAGKAAKQEVPAAVPATGRTLRKRT